MSSYVANPPSASSVTDADWSPGPAYVEIVAGRLWAQPVPRFEVIAYHQPDVESAPVLMRGTVGLMCLLAGDGLGAHLEELPSLADDGTYREEPLNPTHPLARRWVGRALAMSDRIQDAAWAHPEVDPSAVRAEERRRAELRSGHELSDHEPPF